MGKRFFVLAGCCFLTVLQANAVTVASQFVAEGFTDPVFVTHAPGDTTRLFVVEQAGRIKIIKNGTVLGTAFLDISSKVFQGGGERGLLSVAFHPNSASNGFFYVNYINTATNTQVERYHVTANPDVADNTSGFPLFTITQPDVNHKGGWMGFGPNDGYLYISAGDGGPGDDPSNQGQSTNTLLGKILRIDVDNGSPFSNPASNPFFGAIPGNDSIWAYGLRNPWRCSFDKSTGDLWIGDVGQGALEEVDFQPASSTGGENYGWKVAEGFECRGGGGTCGTQSGFTPPVLDYPRTDGHSVTGGYVYRGTAIAGLQGTYFYADYVFGNIWSFEYTGSIQNFTNRTAQLDPPGARTISAISTFGEDANGELYIVDYNDGEIFKIVSNDPDTDGDGLTNSQEGTLGTDPNDSDTDNDGLTDGAEVNTYGTNPLDNDSDNDGLTDGAEVNTHGTNPLDSDSDNDGLSDGAEVNTYGSNPLAVDSDGDSLSDFVEVNTYGTDPTLVDTDGDAINDDTEIAYGSDPLDPFDFPPVPSVGTVGLVTLMGVLCASGYLISRRRRSVTS